jgi:hypothetical protein
VQPRPCTNTSTHASQTQARTQHKPPFWRLPGRLRVLSSASLGGSIFCSWTCPEQGSHIVVLDGSLFEKEQGGHTFGHGPHGAATLGYSNRGQRRRRTNTVPPSRVMEPMPQGGDGVDIVIVLVVPVASILPLGVPRLGVGVGAALEAPRIGALAMVACMACCAARTVTRMACSTGTWRTPLGPTRPISASGQKRILHGLDQAPPQRSVRAGPAGGIRPWQRPWMISARSCSRHLLGLCVCSPCPCVLCMLVYS